MPLVGVENGSSESGIKWQAYPVIGVGRKGQVPEIRRTWSLDVQALQALHTTFDAKAMVKHKYTIA